MYYSKVGLPAKVVSVRDTEWVPPRVHWAEDLAVFIAAERGVMCLVGIKSSRQV
jgi:hypothetical protein